MDVKHRPLLYIETSVFGFYFDQNARNVLRREAAVALLEQIRLGILEAATSPLTYDELRRTAEPLRSRLLPLAEGMRRLVADRQEIERLTRAYVDGRVIPEDFEEDATHVAYATIAKADVLVSFNLRHLANEWAERRIASVNLQQGYLPLRIRTPEEVLEYGD
jgi:hypothetical protein